MTIVLTTNTTATPYVRVDVNTVPAAAVTLTGWRTVAGREMKVRGLVDVAADGASVLDYEAARGVESSYRVQYFNSAGEFIGWSTPEVVTLPATGAVYDAWFHNPLDPSTSVKVELRGQGERSLRRPIDVETFRPANRSVGVAIFRGPRRGFEGLVLDCMTTSVEDETRFDALFGGYDDATVPIVCIRAAPQAKLPPVLFALIADPQMAPYDGADFDALMPWRLTGNEVAPPAAALVVALLSYADFTAFYTALGAGDYAGFTAAYLDYTEASRDYSIAGAA